MFSEGQWIIDNDNGKIGHVVKTHPEHVTAKFGRSIVTLKHEKISLAPLDLHAEDYEILLDMALAMKDRGWFYTIWSKMGEMTE